MSAALWSIRACFLLLSLGVAAQTPAPAGGQTPLQPWQVQTLSTRSSELKGAEAIAFKMVDGADSDRCGVDDAGHVNCLENSTARFEIYLPQSLNLPAANPGVKFFEGGRTTSDWYLSNINERITKSTRYEKGQYQIPPGEMPRFRNP